MKIRLNPIVRKDLQVAARSMRLSWGVFLYSLILVLAFLLAMLVIQSDVGSVYSNQNIYSYLIYLFPVLAIVQIGIVALIVPIITSSSISGEKERQTFDIMMTTCLSPLRIVWGKVLSGVLRILFYVVAGMPILAISFVVGGMSWANLFYYLVALTLFAIFSGSIGVMCSAMSRRSITAVIRSFVVYFVIYGLTFLPSLIRMIYGMDAGESFLFYLFNPGVFFEEFFMQIMTGQSLFDGNNISSSDVGFFTGLFSNGTLWMFISGACIILMTVVFLLVAAWMINPMHSYAGRKRRKKKKGTE